MSRHEHFQTGLRAAPGVALIIAIVVAGIYAFAFHEPQRSAIDGRRLTELEGPTVATLDSRLWMDTIDAYMDDRIPGREFLLTSHAVIQSSVLRDPVLGGQYVRAEDGSLVPNPGTPEVRSSFASDASALASSVAPAPVLWVYVPRKQEIYEDALPRAWQTDALSEAREQTLASLSGSGRILDLTPMMTSRRRAEDAYFTADHHWTPTAAKEAADTIAKMLRESGVPLGTDLRRYENYEGTLPFYGSSARRTTKGVTSSDRVVVSVPSQGFQATMCIDGECGLPTFQAENLTVPGTYANRYRAFMDGDHGYVHMTNDAGHASGRLLVLKDSYANPVLTYLAEHAAEIIVIDERHYEGATLDVVASEFQPDMVLVIHALPMSDSEFNANVWVRTSR